MAGTVEIRGTLSGSGLLAAIGNTTDGVYAVDEAHRIVLWNDAAHRILGYSAEEVIGKLCYQVVAGRDARGNLICQGGCADMALARAGSIVPSRDMVVPTKSAGEVWVNVTNIPIPSELGGLSTVVHIFREVPSRTNMEQLVDRLSSLVERFAAVETEQVAYRQSSRTHHELLTPRERESLGLIVRGANAASIAQSLVISPTTARKHVQNILKKLKVHTTLEAAAYAYRHNLLDSFPANGPPLP